MQRHLELVPQDETSTARAQPKKTVHVWASACMMCVAVFGFIYEALAYDLIFLVRILPAVGKGAMVAPLAVLFNVPWLLGMWSYVQAHSSDPGVVPEQWYEFVRETGGALAVVPARAEWQPAVATFCRKCLVPRPERAHHCLVCGACVLRMDHHCPWLNNCVGFHNHKFFLLLGIYADFACVVALTSTMPELIRCVASLVDAEAGFHWMPEVLAIADVAVFVSFGILTSTICTLLSQMLVVHAVLAAKNSTSIEDQYKNMSNPFDQGSVVANLAQVFGAYGLDWFLPIRPKRPLSDGVAYACADEESASLLRLNLDSLERGSDSSSPSRDSAGTILWRMRYNVRAPNNLADNDADWSSGPFFPQLFGCVNNRRWRQLKRGENE